jgi:hypothetical protein
VQAVYCKRPEKDEWFVQSFIFDKKQGWTLEKAKEWFEKQKHRREHVYALTPILEKIIDKPLRIKGVAMTAGMSRNWNIYTPEELEPFTSELAGSPVYLEHVSALNAVGKVIKTEWDPETQTLLYEAEIYDDEAQEKLRKGLIQHVSVAADYDHLDVLDGKVPHGLHNAELSLVAVPGIPQTNIQIMEKLHPPREQAPMKGRPKSDRERLIDHFGEETALKLLELIGEEAYKLLPERGSKTAQRAVGAPARPTPPKPQIGGIEMKNISERVWTRNYINNLPDSAFAIILPDGKKDDEGKTVPRSLRKFPHHNNNGKIDLPHLRNANARVPQSDLSAEQKEKALAHLDKHKKAAGIGKAGEEAFKRVIKDLKEQQQEEQPPKCPPGQVWDKEKKQCVPIEQQATEILRKSFKHSWIREQEGEAPPEEVPEVEFEIAPEPTLDEVIDSMESALLEINQAIDQVNQNFAELDERVKALEEPAKPSPKGQGEEGTVQERRRGQGIVEPEINEEEEGKFGKLRLRDVMEDVS